MNFERVDDELSNDHRVKLNQKHAGKYLFHLIKQYAMEGEVEEYEPEFDVEAIDELLGYLRNVIDNGWSKVVIEEHSMATSGLLVKEWDEYEG